MVDKGLSMLRGSAGTGRVRAAFAMANPLREQVDGDINSCCLTVGCNDTMIYN